MSDDVLLIRVAGEEAVETVENALDAVADEHDVMLNDAGPPTEFEITKGDAVARLAEAYTGWSA